MTSSRIAAVAAISVLVLAAGCGGKDGGEIGRAHV